MLIVRYSFRVRIDQPAGLANRGVTPSTVFTAPFTSSSFALDSS